MNKSIHPVIYEDEDVRVALERTSENTLIIHCHVSNWGVGKYKKFFDIWVDILDAVKDKGYKEIYAGIDSDKLAKFAGMFGFEFEDSKTMVCTDGKVRGVMKCLIS